MCKQGNRRCRLRWMTRHSRNPVPRLLSLRSIIYRHALRALVASLLSCCSLRSRRLSLRSILGARCACDTLQPYPDARCARVPPLAPLDLGRTLRVRVASLLPPPIARCARALAPLAQPDTSLARCACSKHFSACPHALASLAPLL